MFAQGSSEKHCDKFPKQHHIMLRQITVARFFFFFSFSPLLIFENFQLETPYKLFYNAWFWCGEKGWEVKISW